MKGTFEKFYETDADKAVKGVPVLIGYNDDGTPVKIIVAEAGNPNHEKLQRKYAKALEKSRSNEKRRHDIMARIIAESILLGWEGVRNADGFDVAPTLENRISALVAHKKLFIEVTDAASDVRNFQEDGEAPADEAKADTEKN